jgi:hypothetical protein
MWYLFRINPHSTNRLFINMMKILQINTLFLLLISPEIINLKFYHLIIKHFYVDFKVIIV